MAGLLSKGIKFYTGTATQDSSTGAWTINASTEVLNLQSIPSLGGDIEKVDVTTLADGARHYIPGIKDYGDLEFTFLYDGAASGNFAALKALEDAGSVVGVKVGIPDGASGAIGTTFEFPAMISVSLDEAGVNDALTFTCGCALQGDIDVTTQSN